MSRGIEQSAPKAPEDALPFLSARRPRGRQVLRRVRRAGGGAGVVIESCAASRILTLLFTDLADSTALKTKRGDQAVGELLARHRAHVQELAAESGGRIVDWAGDGCFLTFETPSAAVLFALRLEQMHADEPDLPGVRIGVHMGEVSERPGPDGDAAHPRVEGLAVDLAARIAGLARPAQVLMSAAVADSARQRLDTTALGTPIVWQTHGDYLLKGFDSPLEIREAGIAGVAPLVKPPASEKATPVSSRASAVTRVRLVPVVISWAVVLGIALAYLMLSRGSDRSGADLARPTAATPLGASLTVPGFGGRPAIAVLPFDNLSADPEQEYFADGLAEDLITRLSLWRTFPVIARNSSFVYKGKAVDLKHVSADLGVRYVVEGSVRKAGNRVRISAQLIDATTGRHVWAGTYDRDLTDIFTVQDEISSAIAASLTGNLQQAEQVRAERRAPENLEAWGLYQRALPLIYRFTRESNEEARNLLGRAVAMDPEFASARAKLAETLLWAVSLGWADAPDHALAAALAEARRAVALDSKDPQAHADLAFALMMAGRIDEAVDEARQATDLNPSDPVALNFYAFTLNLAGHPPEDSIKLVQRAMRLSPHDPLEILFYDTLGPAYFNAGRYAEGLAAARRLIALRPTYYFGYLYGAMNAAELGDVDEARDLVRQARQVQPELSIAFVRQGMAAMAPDVDRRMMAALRKAGLE
jgi:TolB-like protein/class 3 adenylate cyclase/cytochrome c-type biogenesis protein CcmH/NrfG